MIGCCKVDRNFRIPPTRPLLHVPKPRNFRTYGKDNVKKKGILTAVRQIQISPPPFPPSNIDRREKKPRKPNLCSISRRCWKKAGIHELCRSENHIFHFNARHLAKGYWVYIRHANCRSSLCRGEKIIYMLGSPTQSPEHVAIDPGVRTASFTLIRADQVSETHWVGGGTRRRL